MEGQAAWAQVKGGCGLKWDREGRDLKAALKYEHPGAALQILELSLSFSISQVSTGDELIEIKVN